MPLPSKSRALNVFKNDQVRGRGGRIVLILAMPAGYPQEILTKPGLWDPYSTKADPADRRVFT
jgi:hypothetical protein